MSGPSSRVQDSGSLAQQLGARTTGAALQIVVGQVTDVTAGVVTVNLGGVSQTQLMTLAPVDVGDNVLVAQQGSGQGAYLYVIGPLAVLAPPIIGTVASVPTNSYVLPVTTVIGTVSAWFPDTYTPTAGDTVILSWLGTQVVILGKQGKTGSPPAPTPKPPPTTPEPPPDKPTVGTTTYQAIACGTWRAGDGWRNDANGNVIQGTAPSFAGLNDGAWFYGGRIRGSLAGATVTKAQIWLGRTEGGNYGGQTVHLYRITQDRRPGGNVTFTATTATASLDVGDKGWYTLPRAFAQELVDSGGSIGIQAASGPYVRLYGLAQSGNAGAVRLTWSK